MKVIWEKEYHGFEAVFDLDRDISEFWDDVEDEIPPEFQGTLKVTISYEEEKD
jgi:hypothetical protein